MADFTNGFWNIWIIVLTVLGIVGCTLLLWQQSNWKVKKGEEKAAGSTTGHVWDEDLTELNNPLPRWWMWLFYLTIFFSIGYLVAIRAWATCPAPWAGVPPASTMPM